MGKFDNALRYRPEDHPRQAFLTPAYILEPVRALLGGIGLDPCTEPDNPTRAERFYALPEDGGALPWDARNVYCNPPYGAARVRWVRRAIAEGARRPVVLLIPAHTETRPFHEALRAATTSCFVRGRVRFGVLRENRREAAASHGSVLFGFGVDLRPLSELGSVVAPRLGILVAVAG